MTTQGSKSRKVTTFLLAFLITIVGGFLLFLIIWLGMSRPETSMDDLPVNQGQVTAEVYAGQPVLVSMLTGNIMTFAPGDVMVFLPANATAVQGSISINPQEPNILGEAGEPGWNRPIIANVEYRDRQGEALRDIYFEVPLEVCFNLDDVQWEAYLQRPDDHQVQFYDESQEPPVWQALSVRTYPARLQLCGVTNHLSLFALAVLSPAYSATPTSTQPGPYEP